MVDDHARRRILLEFPKNSVFDRKPTPGLGPRGAVPGGPPREISRRSEPSRESPGEDPGPPQGIPQDPRNLGFRVPPDPFLAPKQLKVARKGQESPPEGSRTSPGGQIWPPRPKNDQIPAPEARIRAPPQGCRAGAGPPAPSGGQPASQPRSRQEASQPPGETSPGDLPPGEISHENLQPGGCGLLSGRAAPPHPVTQCTGFGWRRDLEDHERRLAEAAEVLPECFS